MDSDESLFEAKRLKIESFKSELKDLVKKHNLGKYETDNYDGEDDYVSTDYYFTIDKQPWVLDTIQEILDDCIIKIL